MSDTSSETSSVCSNCLEHIHEAPPPRKTLLEREFEHVLNRQRDRVARRRRNALRFRSSSDQLKEDDRSDWDSSTARDEQFEHACSLINQYAKEAGISHVPFLPKEGRHSHYSQLELYFLKTRLLREKLGDESDIICSHYARPRWYKALSKEHRRWRLQKRIEERDYIRRTVWAKEKYAFEWYLNLLYLRDALPLFLDPDNKAFQESRVKSPKSVDPKTSRRLLLGAIQNHPIRSAIFSDLSAYEVAKLLYVLFPNETRRAAQKFLGESQVRQWVNPLRDVFGSSQLEAILLSVQKHKNSRISLVLFGPDALELQSRIWDVPGHEARYGCQPDRKLRIFYTYRHNDLDRADRLVFNIEDFFMNGVEIPKPDGEPYRGLTLYPFHLDPFFDDYKPAYGRSLRPSSPDPRIYAEHVWSETALFWTPSLKASRTNSSPLFPEYFGTVTELPAGLELRGGIDHGISTEIVRFVATRRTDLPMVFDGMELRHILEIPFLNFTPPPAPAPPTSGHYTITRNLLTWNPSIMNPEPRYRISQHRLARRDRWRESIRRTRHNVYHTHGGKWHRRARMARETLTFQATFARMAVLDPKFLWECVKEGEITVFWIDLSRWFGS